MGTVTYVEEKNNILYNIRIEYHEFLYELNICILHRTNHEESFGSRTATSERLKLSQNEATMFLTFDDMQTNN